MDNNSRKNSLKKLRSKLKIKLFGQPGVKNITTEPSVQPDVNIRDTAGSSTRNSGLDDQAKAKEDKLNGTIGSYRGTKQDGSKHIHRIGSSTYFSDDEGSDSDLVLKMNTRKKRRISSELRKQAQQLSSSSSSSSYHGTQHSLPKNNPSPLVGSSVAKKQRKKLTKNQRNNEKKPTSKSYIEFSSDSKSLLVLWRKNN